MFNAFALTIGGPSARHDDADSAEERLRFLLRRNPERRSVLNDVGTIDSLACPFGSVSPAFR